MVIFRLKFYLGSYFKMTKMKEGRGDVGSKLQMLGAVREISMALPTLCPQSTLLAQVLSDLCVLALGSLCDAFLS